MKKLVGGDYLLDLTPIELEESVDGETYTNITNADIIAQLTNLKKFVPNPSMVKPVWVKLKNGETDEIVVARGEFKVVDAGEFEIVVPIDGYKLKIHIEFTQVLNDDSVPMDDWYIDTNDAKYLFTSDLQNIGDIIGTGEIDNAKPIYYHPIALRNTSSGRLGYVSFIILDNNPEPYTKETLITKINNFNRISPLSGAIVNPNTEKTLICSYAFKFGEEVHGILGVYTDGTYEDGQGAVLETFINYADTTLSDGVNKIN